MEYEQHIRDLENDIRDLENEVDKLQHDFRELIILLLDKNLVEEEDRKHFYN